MIRDFICIHIPIFTKFAQREPLPLVWLVHPRGEKDIAERSVFLRILPYALVRKFISLLPPHVVSVIKTEGKPEGYVIAVPLLPEHFQHKKKMSRKKTQNALSLARKNGATTVSVGGFFSSFIKKQGIEVGGIQIVDGTNLLPRIVLQKTEELVNTFSGKDVSVGIIGATTETGKTTTKLVAQLRISELYLFGKTPQNLSRLKDEVEAMTQNNKVLTATNFAGAKHCDILIVTAYIENEEGLIENIKQKATLISAVEPTSPFVAQVAHVRSDVNVIKDITIKTPGLSYAGLSFGLEKEHAFVCLTEAILATQGDTFAATQGTKVKDVLQHTQQILQKHSFKPRI